jgi:hypothetical protein
MSHTLRSSDEALQEAIEQYLARLESLVCEFSGSHVFFNELARGLIEHCGATAVGVWVREKQREDCLFRSAGYQVALPENSPQELPAAAARDGSRGMSVENSFAGGIASRLVSSSPVDQASTVILDVLFGGTETPLPATQLNDIVHAVTDLAVSFSLRARLETTNRKLVEQQAINRVLAVSVQPGSLEDKSQALATILLDALNCDRVSVFQVTATGARPLAVVPAANLNQRSSQLELLRQLAVGVMAAEGWLTVRVGAGLAISPGLRPIVERYLEASLAREVWALGTCLRRTDLTLRTGSGDAVVVVERFTVGDANEHLPRQNNVARSSLITSPEESLSIVSHSETLLAMALDTIAQQLSLRRQLALTVYDHGRTSSVNQRARLVAMVASLILLILFLIPAPLDFPAEGSIQPRSAQTIFATREGVVEKLLVQNGQAVAAGQPLLKIRSPELELEFYQLTGEVETLESKLLSLRSAKAKHGSERESEAALRLSAEEEDVKIQLLGVRKQLEIVTADRESLTLLSPLQGIVDGWDIEQSLDQRPVLHGQRLLRVFTPEDGWQLHLEIPNDTAGFILEAQQSAPCKVEFRVRSDPSQRYRASLSSTSQAIQVNAAQQAMLLAKVDLLQEPVNVTRAGAKVVAQINCGQSTLGLIWFRKIIEFLQRSFWL